MVSLLLNSSPLLILIVIYFVRLEIKIAKIQQDICWIKKNMNKCLPD